MSLRACLPLGDLAAWHISLHMRSVAKSTLLAEMAPVIGMLVSWLFLHQKISGAFIAGLVLSVEAAISMSR